MPAGLKSNNSPIGLYFHIPFCSRICSYCDFKKTAMFNPKTLSNYVDQLCEHFLYFKRYLDGSFYSLYFGGGSPSCLTHEYEKLFNCIRSYINQEAEITIEANPEDLTKDNLKLWSDLGINRLSLGVQALDPKAREFLTRENLSYKELMDLIELGYEFFSNINIDLIYGIPIRKQFDIFFKDLNLVIDKINPQHLSLYSLTYSSKTPLGLRLNRGIVHAVADSTLALMYKKISELLKNKDYIHEEVSNWHLAGWEAKHSNLYWSGGYYLGIGPGACGFLPLTDRLAKDLGIIGSLSLGYRYSYEGTISSFIEESSSDFIKTKINEDQRNYYDYLCEYIGSSLRSNNGVDLKLIEDLCFYTFKPSSVVEWAISKGYIKISDNKIYLDPCQWFLETSWSLKLIESFVKINN